MFKPFARLRRFRQDRQGSIAMIGAVALPIMLGFASLVAEYGNGLLIQAETQRIADSAAYAGALAYVATGTITSMTSAATAVARLNGVADANVSTSLVASTTGDGNSAVRVFIASNIPLLLAPVLGGASNLPVNASAFAELKPSGSPCILALNSSGAGLSLSGAASVSAASCTVSSNAAVTAPCGTALTTATLTYGASTAPVSCSGANIKPPTGSAAVSMIRKTTADPMASSSAVVAATAALALVSSETAPAAPPAAPASLVGGGDISFGGNVLVTELQAVADGCVAVPLLSTWTLTCTGLTPFSFGNITLASGYSLNFNLTPLLPSAALYYFSGTITNNGTSMTFGPGTYNIAKGVVTGGNSTTSFGAGSFVIGAATAICGGTGAYSICNAGTSLSFAGPSTFKIRAGIYNAAGSKLTLGSGVGNSLQIGAASDHNALYVGAAATTTLGDASAASSLFQLGGNVTVAGGGGCTSFGAAASHDIQGNLTTAGGTSLGAGAYLVTGSVGLGANGGGDVACSGSTLGLSGAGVTLVLGGTTTLGSGACSGLSFCIASGYSNVALTAPTSGAFSKMVVIGPTSGVTAGASLTQGASSTSLMGAVYFPGGPVTLTGSATVNGGGSQCLTLVGAAVALAGGTTGVSSCLPGASSYSAALVQ